MRFQTQRKGRSPERTMPHDGSMFGWETYKPAERLVSNRPGNGAHNMRRLAVLETNAADMSFLFTLDPASEQPPPSPRGTRDNSRPASHDVRFNRTWRTWGHTLVPGCDRQKSGRLTDQFSDVTRRRTTRHGRPDSATLSKLRRCFEEATSKSVPVPGTTRSIPSRSSRRGDICTSCMRCPRAAEGNDGYSDEPRPARSTTR